MARSYYEILGLKQSCSADEVRSAYRKLVLKYHPDRSSDPRAADIFIEITEAYGVLSDRDKRQSYDHNLRQAAAPKGATRPTAEQSRRPAQPPPNKAETKRTTVATEVTRLTMLFTRGQYSDAETLAKRIVAMDGKQPVPYAVLGDLARSRGNLKEATRMYAYAVQMDPRNPIYQRRYEELLDTVVAGAGSKEAKEGMPALIAGFVLVLIMGIYLALSREAALFPAMRFVSSWTLGLMVMALLSGIVLGACLAIGQWLDRLGSSATPGRIEPAVALASVAIVNFWVAALLYGVLGASQRSFNVSTSRLVGSIGIAVGILSLCAAVSPSLNATQVFVWSGNLMYLGSLSGWMVADAFRKA